MRGAKTAVNLGRGLGLGVVLLCRRRARARQTRWQPTQSPAGERIRIGGLPVQERRMKAVSLGRAGSRARRGESDGAQESGPAAAREREGERESKEEQGELQRERERECVCGLCQSGLVVRIAPLCGLGSDRLPLAANEARAHVRHPRKPDASTASWAEWRALCGAGSPIVPCCRIGGVAVHRIAPLRDTRGIDTMVTTGTVAGISRYGGINQGAVLRSLGVCYYTVL